MSHENQNSTKNPEIIKQLPEGASDVADEALDTTTGDPTDRTVQLQNEVEAFLADSDFSYEKYGFQSPTEIIERNGNNPRQARAFIQSRRSNPETPAAVKLADEQYLRAANNKARNSAASDEYLQTLLNAASETVEEASPNPVVEPDNNSSIPLEAPDEPQSEMTATPDVDTDDDSSTVPAVRVKPVTNATTGSQQPNQPATTNTSPSGNTQPNSPTPNTPAPAVRLSPVDQPNTPERSGMKIDVNKVAKLKAELLNVERELKRLNNEISLAENDSDVSPNDVLTAERKSRVEALNARRDKLRYQIGEAELTPETAQQTDELAKNLFDDALAKEASARQEQIAALLTVQPSARQERRQQRRENLDQLRSDRESLAEYMKSHELPDEYKKIPGLLSNHARQVGAEKLSRLSHMSFLLERKWRNHPIHSDLDEEERRKALDEILFAEDGMLLKLFTANSIDYDKLTPGTLHDILFAANTKNVLRASRSASMGRVVCGASNMVSIGFDLTATGLAAGSNFIVPFADGLYYGHRGRSQRSAIAHLDRAAAKKYRSLETQQEAEEEVALP